MKKSQNRKLLKQQQTAFQYQWRATLHIAMQLAVVVVVGKSQLQHQQQQQQQNKGNENKKRIHHICFRFRNSNNNKCRDIKCFNVIVQRANSYTHRHICTYICTDKNYVNFNFVIMTMT